MVDPKWIVGDFVFFVDERIRLSDVDLNAAYQIVTENPTRLVTFYAAHYVVLKKINLDLVFCFYANISFG